MKLINAIIYFCMTFQLHLIAQAQDALNSGEKFNTNEYFVTSGRERLNNYDGNFLLEYSTPVQLPNDLGGDFTIIYNANVPHKTFRDTWDDVFGVLINSPEWVLGFKGIAIQTFNFETHYALGQGSPNLNFSGEYAPLLIPGYHFTNKITPPTLDFERTDYISILMADGSTKTLINSEEWDYLGEGIYVEAGKDNTGFAIVKKINPESNLRNIYYKPGDGLTYKFTEEPVNYYDKYYQDSMQGLKIMYLVKVFKGNEYDINSDNIEFIYSNAIGNYGRKVFTELKSNRKNPNGMSSELGMLYNLQNGMLFSAKITNDNSDDKYDIYFNEVYQNSPLTGDNRNSNKSKILPVLKITDRNNRSDNFSSYCTAYPAYRSYRDYPILGIWTLNIHHYSLINQIDYFNGKTTKLDYWNKFFSPRADSETYSLELNSNLQQCSENVTEAFRDCYTNFMLKNRKFYNKYNGIQTLTLTENYKYSRSGSEGIISSNVNNIFTEIEMLNNLEISTGADKSIQIVKNYSRKRTIDKDVSLSRRIPTIILMSDSTIELDFAPIPEEGETTIPSRIVNRYQYNFGNRVVIDPSDESVNYYDGTFRMTKSIKDKYSHSYSPIFSLETLYSVIDESTLSFDGGLFNKRIVITQKEEDPNQLITETSFTNFLPASPILSTFNDTNFYFDSGKLNYKKIYKGTSVKYYKKSDYYIDEYSGQFKGMLKKVTQNITRPSFVDYYYYTAAEDNYYRGFLKYTENSNGLRIDNYYPGVIGGQMTSSAIGIVQRYDGSSSSITFQHNGFQLQPFKTVTKINGIELYTNYTSYNVNGLPDFTIDQNGYYSRYHYDVLGRPTTFCLSGSFKDYSAQPSSDGSVLYSYDDDNNILTETKRMDNNPANLFSKVTKYEYDSFGKLRTTSVKNDAGNFELKETNTYNFLGMLAIEEDALNHKKWHKYDYLSRLLETRFVRNTDNIHKTIEYELQPNPTVFYEYNIFADEEGKIKKKYFDNAENLVKEEKINGDSILTTLYNYDNLYRLTSVTSPAGKITSYLYDDHSNISQKTSPDEGTTKYKYDKYGNLRFSLNFGAPPSQYALIFNKYDNMGRLILTGQLTSTYGFDLLYPDMDYSNSYGGLGAFENYSTNQGNFVLVNMYDKYTRTGVFANLYNFAAGTLQNLKGKLVATAFRDKTGDTWNYKVYSYDHLGRVKDFYVFFQSTFSYKKITNEYDNLGNLTKQNVDNQFYYWYSYDEQGRLKEVRSNMHDAYTTAKLEAVYTYDKSDKVLTAAYGTMGNYAPREMYFYDNRGRIIDLYGIATDMFNVQFRQIISYYNNDNVNTMYLKNNGNCDWPDLNFTYTYDGFNRLDSAKCSNNYYTEVYTYNPDGNLLTKKRPYNSSQSLDYYYNTAGKNYLTSLTKGGTSYSFGYDYKGNMLTDTRKTISGMVYDRRNLPITVTKSGVNYTYKYDDSGQRIYKQLSSTNKEFYLRDHTGKELAVYDWYTGKLKMFNLFGNGVFGKVNVTYNAQNVRTDSRQYYIKDYLGSIRMTIDERTFDVISAQDYFPFGGIMENRSYTTGGNVNDKYKFTEKERDTETNYDYFGARYYDSDLGRWLSVDPLADKYPGWSPYNYTLNNPLRFIDPTGMEAVDVYPDDPDDKTKQESTINYIQKLGNYIKEGAEVISDGVSTSVNQGSQVLKQGLEVVAQSTLTNGPGILNNLSDGVAVLGISVGTGFLSAGQAEIGGPILVGSLTLSTRLDLAAFGLTLIDYGFNGGDDRLNKLSNQTDRLLLGGAFGTVLGKVASAVKIFTPIYNPIIF